MPYTDGRWTHGPLVPGFEKFISALEFIDMAGLATIPSTIATAGLVFKTVPSGDAAIFAANIGQFLCEPVYATPAYDQEQFGTGLLNLGLVL